MCFTDPRRLTRAARRLGRWRHGQPGGQHLPLPRILTLGMEPPCVLLRELGRNGSGYVGPRGFWKQAECCAGRGRYGGGKGSQEPTTAGQGTRADAEWGRGGAAVKCQRRARVRDAYIANVYDTMSVCLSLRCRMATSA